MNTVEQAQVVSQSELRPGQGVTRLALFDEEGAPLDLSGFASGSEIDELEAVTEDDADAAAGSTPTKAEFDALVALANANKAAVNAVIAALQA